MSPSSPRPALLELAPAPGETRGVDGAVRQVTGRLPAPSSSSAVRDERCPPRPPRLRAGGLRFLSAAWSSPTPPPAGRSRRSSPGGLRSRTTSVETAEPGDIIGLVNADALRVGDTVTVGPSIEYPPVPTFAPEHFVTASASDIGRYKQFPPAVSSSSTRGRPGAALRRPATNPVLAAVGPIRFRVVGTDGQQVQRPHSLLGSTPGGPPVPIPPAPAALAGIRGVEVLQRSDGTTLALFVDQWRARDDRARPSRHCHARGAACRAADRRETGPRTTARDRGRRRLHVVEARSDGDLHAHGYRGPPGGRQRPTSSYWSPTRRGSRERRIDAQARLPGLHRGDRADLHRNVVGKVFVIAIPDRVVDADGGGARNRTGHLGGDVVDSRSQQRLDAGSAPRTRALRRTRPTGQR